VARNLQLPSNDGAQANFHRGYNHSENFQPPPQVYGAIDELGRHTMYPSNPAVTQPTTTSSCPPTPARLCQLNGYVEEDDPRGVPNIFEDWEPSSTLIRPHQLHGYMGNGNLTGFNDIFEDWKSSPTYAVHPTADYYSHIDVFDDHSIANSLTAEGELSSSSMEPYPAAY
jgi:hypothetical protein